MNSTLEDQPRMAPSKQKKTRGSSACWCTSDEWNVAFRTSRFGLICCRACGTHRIDPPPVSNNNDVADFYTSYYESRVDRVASASNCKVAKLNSRFWRVAEQFSPLYQPGRCVLDIGCGDGGLCAELAGQGWKNVVGLDVSRARIERARRRRPDITFLDTDIEKTVTPKESIDLVILDNVIEHLLSPLDYMGSLREYVRNNGRIVLITPNMRCGHFRLLGRFWTPELAPHVHVYLFTPNSLGRLLESAGFAVEMTGSFHIPVRLPDLRKPKEAIWRTIQEMGSVYGHIIGQGSMGFAIGKRVDA
jgi:2-polyprenyl-3-methyl-5-hydroxy-6-metoxy-1,4-benzoquinol methylase